MKARITSTLLVIAVAASALLGVVVAALAMYALPQGFAVDDRHFWTNRALPAVALGALLSLCGFVALQKHRLVVCHLVGVATFFASIAISWRAVFPHDVWRPTTLALIAAAWFVLLAALYSLNHRTNLSSKSLPVAARLTGTALPILAGAIPAALWVYAQRGAAAATRPAFESGSQVVRFPDDTTPSTEQLPPWLAVFPSTESARIRWRHIEMEVQPLLTLSSRSVDRGWTLFANDDDRRGPRRYPSRVPPSPLPNPSLLHYDGGEPSQLAISATENSVTLDAMTSLAQPIYSHLNTFTKLDLMGHSRLFIAFSPTGTTRFEVKFAEYPTGLPMRLAYLDRENVFHVVQADSGEKGPFTELAAGAMPSDSPLVLSVFDEDELIATYTFSDFAAQVSTQASPTAGWGLPENAITFALYGKPSSPFASITLSLAGTAVGRGFNSVGHRAGSYRNRLRIDLQ